MAEVKPFKVVEKFRRIRSLWDSGESPGDAHLLITPEGFQEELVTLGLSGRKFEPRDYAEALGEYLEIDISLCVFSDSEYPELVRTLARTGKVAELCYSVDQSTAVILVPESLPSMVRILALYHELGHLAAGDLPGGPTRRLVRRQPLGEGKMREEEADLRAKHALLAGSLGHMSPYSERMYDIL